ncbi:unnamed protein product [Microthlaspi erraticum]|uniref:Uncharacterized protein n=1 Tax=Microthlaspi erraticum TaxID=1685480 RepID=A0A6D2KMY8_9BRAS|nr:unnamed protein product [Microthlaspi erraticum]
MFSPLTVVSSGLGRRSLEVQPMDGELELESPIQLLVLNEKVGLAKLDVHPTWFSGSLSVGFTPAAHKIGRRWSRKASSSLCQIYLPLILLPSLCVREWA